MSENMNTVRQGSLPQSNTLHPTPTPPHPPIRRRSANHFTAKSGNITEHILVVFRVNKHFYFRQLNSSAHLHASNNSPAADRILN
jgi:hypothetical protein